MGYDPNDRMECQFCGEIEGHEAFCFIVELEIEREKENDDE